MNEWKGVALLTMPKIVINIEKTSSHISTIDNNLLRYSKGILPTTVLRLTRYIHWFALIINNSVNAKQNYVLISKSLVMYNHHWNDVIGSLNQHGMHILIMIRKTYETKTATMC